VHCPKQQAMRSNGEFTGESVNRGSVSNGSWTTDSMGALSLDTEKMSGGSVLMAIEGCKQWLGSLIRVHCGGTTKLGYSVFLQGIVRGERDRVSLLSGY